VRSCGHEAVAYTGGKAVIEAMKSPDAPQLCVLDWMMPEVSGLDVIKHMTQTGSKEQRYVIILSAKDNKQEIAQILNAGADDYVIKPMNQDEFVARLRVAERTIAYQNELRDKTLELEALLRKHNLLNAIARTSHLVLQQDGEGELCSYFNRYDAGSVAVDRALKLDAVAFFDRVVLPTFERMGLSPNVVQPVDAECVHPCLRAGYTRHHAVAWRAVYIPQVDLWLDIVLDAELEVLHAIAKKILDVATLSNGQLQDFFGEAIGLVVSSFNNHLHRQNMETACPFFSRALLTEALPDIFAESKSHLQWKLLIEGKYICHAHIFAHTMKVTQKLSRNLQTFDISAEDIVPKDRQDTVFIKKWEVLTRNHTRHIERWVSYQTIRDSIAVISPSELACRLQKLETCI